MNDFFSIYLVCTGVFGIYWRILIKIIANNILKYFELIQSVCFKFEDNEDLSSNIYSFDDLIPLRKRKEGDK